MKQKPRRIGLNRETLRRLDEERLRQAAAGYTGTATFTCQANTCGNCVTLAVNSCRCTPYLG